MNAPEHSSDDGPALARVRLHVAYHGAHFHGFASNAESPTVEDVLVSAIGTVVRHPIRLTTAGRTDAGVHARSQVVSFDIPAGTRLDALVRSINALCAPHVAVSGASFVDDDFDARRSATWRRYRYFVHNAPEPDPMLLDRAWHLHRPLSLPLMNLAADALCGHQDFSAFCRRAPLTEEGKPRSMMRHVFEARWHEEPDRMMVFEIRANAFCHQMVRGIVGFLVDVGLKKRPASDTRAALVAGERSHGSQVAPPHGLVLWDVGYDGARIHP